MPRVLVALLICAAVAIAAAQQPPPAPQQPPPASSQPPAAPSQPATPPAGATTRPAPSTEPQPSAAGARVFTGDAGLIFFPVKPDRTAEFEQIMAKLKEALQASADPVRREQAAGWKVFKALEPGPNNTTLYVFVIDPAVKGADYGFWKTMYEAFPA